MIDRVASEDDQSDPIHCSLKLRLLPDELTPPLVHPNFLKSAIAYHIECLRLMYEALNIDEKKLITQFYEKLRDERFEPN